MNAIILIELRIMVRNDLGLYNLSDCSLPLRITQLEGIYLVELSSHKVQNKVTRLPQLSAREVDLWENNALALDYTAYQLTRQIKTATQAASTRICQQQQDPLQNEPVQVRPGEFALIHGDVYHRFQCINKTFEIEEVSDCWLDIPMKGGGSCMRPQPANTPHSSKTA